MYDYVYTDKCMFKGHCPRESKQGCDVSCPIQPEFYFLLDSSNVPKKYLGQTVLYPTDNDVEAFITLRNIKEDIENFVLDGRTLYLWSKAAGTGKTSMACKMLKSYLAYICIGNGFQERAYFSYIPTMLLTMKDFDHREQRQELVDILKTRELVVLDDIGAVKNTEYDRILLSDIINTRYNNQLATIYTSNISPQELSVVVEPRLGDRMCSDLVIEITGNGRRKYTKDYKGGNGK